MIDDGHYDEDAEQAAIMAALQTAGPDDWHAFAAGFNWGEPLGPLCWIVQQPDCDRATAHLIFWAGEPTGYEWQDEEEPLGADPYAVAPLLRFINDRFHGRGFPRAELGYDCLADHGIDMPEYFATCEEGRRRDIAELEASLSAPGLHPLLKELRFSGRGSERQAPVDPFAPLSPQLAAFTDSEDDGPAPDPFAAIRPQLPADPEPEQPEADPFAAIRPQLPAAPEPDQPEVEPPLAVIPAAPAEPPPPEVSFARGPAEEKASARVRDLRRQSDDAPDAAPAASAGGWLRRLLGR
ncbi:hypothetical protein GCM10022281_02860 [Sphingomonas rosea]|uniref:DUF4274 domain-containing protein n=1 Tax=Sphingomonas rosea TaxID=335605 RepID=A0ABP7TL33_9SPHN